MHSLALDTNWVSASDVDMEQDLWITDPHTLQLRCGDSATALDDHEQQYMEAAHRGPPWICNK